MIDEVKKEGDTLGGVVEVVATGVPAGLGGHERPESKLSSGIAAALMFAVLGVTTIWVEPSWGITFLVAALIVGLVPALRR